MHWPDDPSSPVYAEQIRRFQDALRLAGERDHAEEEADFGVAADLTFAQRFRRSHSDKCTGGDDDPHR